MLQYNYKRDKPIKPSFVSLVQHGEQQLRAFRGPIEESGHIANTAVLPR